jgi:site-specific DNA-methyltransferase (adenine-specific)/adenine-specific DNA-methyltransferase
LPTLNWIGKQAVETHHKDVPFRLLEAVPELSAGDTDSGNVMVQGDNLLALKALLPRYAGQVKCIYIDPPYNTGNEGWVYNDNVNSPEIQRWLGDVVGKEGETLDRHDRWLCMMYPRLLLLKQFLRDDGVIFVSIDDNEVGHLRLLMDEIFGANNFLRQIVWHKKYAASNDSKGIPDVHDFIVCYQKGSNFSRNLLPRTAKQNDLYKYDSNDGMGQWRPDNLSVKTYSSNYDYPIKNPITGMEYFPPKGRAWMSNQEQIIEWIKTGRIFFGQKGDGAPQLKRYLSEVQQGIVPISYWSYEEVNHTDGAKKELKDIFYETKLPFETPKPSVLIQRILQIATNKNDLILDSFAGSGTTAHAVLKQNAEDGGNRRFILVEMDATIAQTVTAERVKRVSQGYTNAKGHAVAGLGSGFQFYKLSDKPLFTAEGVIRADVSFTQLAEFVWFMETGTGLALPVDTVLTSPLLGIHNNQAVFLLYNGILKDKTDAGGNVLNSKTLSLLREYLPEATMPSVVYGAFTRFDKAKLQQLNINFHQLPYELAVKTWF